MILFIILKQLSRYVTCFIRNWRYCSWLTKTYLGSCSYSLKIQIYKLSPTRMCITVASCCLWKLFCLHIYCLPRLRRTLSTKEFWNGDVFCLIKRPSLPRFPYSSAIRHPNDSMEGRRSGSCWEHSKLFFSEFACVTY